MYSYLHRYHAGCFADIHKHLTLIALLLQLQKKATPFCVMDTHAGEGIYDLQSEESLKNKEYVRGIEPLIEMPNPSELVKKLLSIIQSYKEQYQAPYPGSPAIVKSFLRPQDSAICIEGHHRTFLNLEQHFGHEPNIHLHERDAFESLNALIPFQEKRGLVFVDPSYEVKTDYSNIADALLLSHSRFSHGIFALWYPILEQNFHEKMIAQFARSAVRSIWLCEWIPYPHENKGMLGSGMMIMNTPWQIDILLKDTFQQLNLQAFPNGLFRDLWVKQ